MFTLKPNNNISPCIHTGHTAEIVTAVKDYLLQNPANFQGQVSSILELLYFHYTEYNPVENDRVRACFLGLTDKLHELARDEEEENQMINLAGDACAEYERVAYMEGIKVGMRLMMEMGDNIHP